MTWTILKPLVALTAIAISLAGSAWYGYSKGKQSGIATTQAQWDAERLATQTARANQEAKNRQIEQELNDATEKHGQEVAALSVAVAAADTRARAAAAGLRSATQAAANRARQVCAAPGASELRPPTDDPIGVLADVLGRIDDRATDLARIADDRGLAGRACEREFDTARDKLNR
jgi:small-conductance mechanosensitive channel